MPAYDVFLHRWAPESKDQARYADACRQLASAPPTGWTVVLRRPAHAMARRSRVWLAASRGEEVVLTNGCFSLVARECADSDLWNTLAVEHPRRVLAGIEGEEVDTAVDHLSLWTTVVLALDEISTLDRQRPRVSGDFSVAEVEDLVRHPVLRYSAGVGAKRRVLDPWRRHITVYRQRITELDAFWSREVRPHVAGLAEDDPLAFLLRPLVLLKDFSGATAASVGDVNARRQPDPA